MVLWLEIPQRGSNLYHFTFSVPKKRSSYLDHIGHWITQALFPFCLACCIYTIWISLLILFACGWIYCDMHFQFCKYLFSWLLVVVYFVYSKFQCTVYCLICFMVLVHCSKLKLLTDEKNLIDIESLMLKHLTFCIRYILTYNFCLSVLKKKSSYLDHILRPNSPFIIQSNESIVWYRSCAYKSRMPRYLVICLFISVYILFWWLNVICLYIFSFMQCTLLDLFYDDLPIS